MQLIEGERIGDIIVGKVTGRTIIILCKCLICKKEVSLTTSVLSRKKSNAKLKICPMCRFIDREKKEKKQQKKKNKVFNKKYNISLNK